MTNYNGWTNYPTWRVHLEIFDGGNWDRYSAEDLKEFVVDQIFAETRSGIARDYALSFISEVNWREIHDSLQEISTEGNNEQERWQDTSLELA
jgi:hypothetical protein